MFRTERKAIVLASLWALALNAGASGAPSEPRGQTPDARAVQTTFSQYRAALLEGDGAKAADVVSARTIAYYDGIVAHALNTSRKKLAELDFISKFMVLRVRHEFTRAELEQMTGRELLAVGVKNGWISKSSVANLEQLVEIKVQESEASASMPAAPEIPAFHFSKESGQWKLNLVASFGLANEAFRHQLTKSGLTEDEFIVRLLGILSSKEVDERIFSPPD